MVPAFSGLGYAMITLGFLGHNNGVLITAWSLYYLAVGFQKTLPWGTCTETWNTNECYSLKYEDECQIENNQTTWYNKTCVTFEEYCQSHGNRTYNNTGEVIYYMSFIQSLYIGVDWYLISFLKKCVDGSGGKKVVLVW